jgi:hypothetical protein
MSRIGGKKVTLLNIVLQGYRPAMSATQSLYNLVMGCQTRRSGLTMVKTGALNRRVGSSSPIKDGDEPLISAVETFGGEATGTIDDEVLLTASRPDSRCMG